MSRLLHRGAGLGYVHTHTGPGLRRCPVREHREEHRDKQAGCKVPKLKGLTVKKAKAALKKAGCKYKLKGKGRVRSFSPKAGTTTQATVQVKCKSKKRKKRSRKSALRIAQYR